MKEENDENNNIDIEKTQIAPEEEDIVEFVYNEDGEEDLKATLKKLRKDTKDAKKEKDEYLDNWQRERAEFANYRREETQRLSRAEIKGKEAIVEYILPALDSFDMAIANKEVWEKVDANWRVGVEYIRSQITTALETAGVTVLTPSIGSVFDPNEQECFGLEEVDEKEKDNTISTIVQKGYKLGNKILRPARVKVFSVQKSDTV
ncbi:MAG: nucleotide exchange factor GrpE [Candidatus Pacebacteria bacterium]|nr:nucleotide exchange factor GrpE [Candidatus Paceibacterota bacterium]